MEKELSRLEIKFAASWFYSRIVYFDKRIGFQVQKRVVVVSSAATEMMEEQNQTNQWDDGDQSNYHKSPPEGRRRATTARRGKYPGQREFVNYGAIHARDWNRMIRERHLEDVHMCIVSSYFLYTNVNISLVRKDKCSNLDLRFELNIQSTPVIVTVMRPALFKPI